MVSRRSVAAVAALALTVLGTFGSRRRGTGAARRAGDPHPGIPPITAARTPACSSIGTATVRKAKTIVTLPLTLLRAYANETSTSRTTSCSATTPTWAVTHIGPHPRFGIFPVAHSAVLGFGAIPITADLHLTQLVQPRARSCRSSCTRRRRPTSRSRRTRRTCSGDGQRAHRERARRPGAAATSGRTATPPCR